MSVKCNFLDKSHIKTKNARMNTISCMLIWSSIGKNKLSSNYEVSLSPIYPQACEEVSVKPCECIMVGDKVETDVLGAIQANLAGTILLSTSSKKLTTSRPHLVIQNVLELNSLIPPASYNKTHLMDYDESSCSSNASRWQSSQGFDKVGYAQSINRTSNVKSIIDIYVPCMTWAKNMLRMKLTLNWDYWLHWVDWSIYWQCIFLVWCSWFWRVLLALNTVIWLEHILDKIKPRAYVRQSYAESILAVLSAFLALIELKIPSF